MKPLNVLQKATGIVFGRLVCKLPVFALDRLARDGMQMIFAFVLKSFPIPP